MRRPPPRGSVPPSGAAAPLLIVLLAASLSAAAAPRHHHAARRAPDEAATQQQLDDAKRAGADQLAKQKEAQAKADSAAAQAKLLADQRVAAAAKLRETEQATLDAASRMEALSRRQREAEERLQKRAESMEPLLPVIERMSLYPVETLLAVDAEPEAALRGILVLQGFGRMLEQQARSLRAEEAALAEARAAVAAEAPKLADAQAAQAAEAAKLDQQIAGAKARGEDAADDAAGFARSAAASAARAATLRGMLDQLDSDRKAAEAQAAQEAVRADKQRRAADADAARRQQAALARPTTASLGAGGLGQGSLTAPVAGTVVRAWGEAGDAGPVNGISYRASPGARVVAPCGGRVAFAAPFRSYGQLVILDCGGGYHVVLAGLDRLDVQAGGAVQPGEPVGVMPGWDPKAAGARPSLYVELRRNGKAVNPAPWLRARG